MREQYLAHGLAPADLAAEPYTQFSRWFADAAKAGLVEPNAMVVSTADAQGRPASRTVLLKGYDHRGFVFFTNYESRKGRDLSANPRASLLFPWHPIARQVIISGDVERVSAEETETYFRSRPHGSRLGAWASAQSTPVDSREELEERYADLMARYPEGSDIPVPPFWGGYRVCARSVEFWQGRENRLHDRLVYECEPDGAKWRITRLCP